MTRLKNIQVANERISKFIKHTPLYYSNYFSQISNHHVYLKLENLQNTNAFNAVADLAEERKCYTRDAAYLISLQRVARAVEGRGWVKTKK